MGSIKHIRSEHNGNLNDTGNDLGQPSRRNACTTISPNSMFRNGIPSRDMLVRRDPSECVESAFLIGSKGAGGHFPRLENEVHEC